MSSTTTSTTGAQSHRRLGHSLPTVCCLGGQQSPKSRLRRRVEQLRQRQGVPLRCLAHVTAVQMKLPQPIVALPHPSFEWQRRGCQGVCVAARSRLGHFCFCSSSFTAARQDFGLFFVLFNGFAIFSYIPLGTQGANRRALRHGLMPNRDRGDQPGRSNGTPKEERGTMLHVQGFSPTSSCSGAGREEEKKTVAAAASRLPCQRIKSDRRR